METRYLVGASDWPHFRFAHSALFETVQALWTLSHRGQQRFHRRWLDSVDRDEVLHRLPALAALTPSTGQVWVPDFLAPPPTHLGFSHIEEDLEHVARYPPRLVRQDLAHSLDSHPTAARRHVLQPLIEQPARARRQLVTELRLAWDTLARPFWPAISRLISDDIGYRSRRLTRLGLDGLLTDLHEDLSYRGDLVTVRRNASVEVTLGGRGLLLMPSAFLWPRPVAIFEPPWPPAVAYPARGVGNLWASRPATPAALANLLGRSRAGILLDLDQPRDTSSAAARQQLSPATTSVHLTCLAAAGLASAHRYGKQVRYQRTELGNALVTASRGHDPVRERRGEPPATGG